MSASVWTKSRRESIAVAGGIARVKVEALVSDSSPGVVLQVGEFADLSNTEAKQINTRLGWRPFETANGCIAGPVLYNLDEAAAYAISASALHVWPSGASPSEFCMVKLYRLWWAATGKEMPEETRLAFEKIEAEQAAESAA